VKIVENCMREMRESDIEKLTTIKEEQKLFLGVGSICPIFGLTRHAYKDKELSLVTLAMVKPVLLLLEKEMTQVHDRWNALLPTAKAKKKGVGWVFLR
jgi:hypothetical protein